MFWKGSDVHVLLKEFALVKSCILFWETVKLYEVENVEFVQKFWFSF